MESNPALLGGSLKSKPTWQNILRCSAMSAFFAFSGRSHLHTLMEDPDGQTFALLCGINADKAVATFRNDVLELHLPKTEVSKAKHTLEQSWQKKAGGDATMYNIPCSPPAFHDDS